MSERPLAFIVEGKSGIHIQLERNDGFDQTVPTNGDGYALFPNCPESPWDVNIHIHDAAYEPYDYVLGTLISGGIPKGGHQLFIGAPSHPITPPFDILLPPLHPRAVGNIGAMGRRITIASRPTPIVGIDGLLDFRYWLDGIDLFELFEESKAFGVNCRRVWFMGEKDDNEVMDLDPREPHFYENVRRYVDYANSHGFIIFGDIFVNNQFVPMGYDHATTMANLVRGSNFIFSGGNEASKNGFDRKKVPNPAMPLWTAGSEQQNGLPEVSTGATVMSFHGVRNWPTSIRDAVASPTQIYDVLGFPDIPLIFDEMVKMGPDGSERCDEPQVCYRFGRHWSSEAAGAVFHNFRAQRGLLLNDQDKRCLEGFVRGMQL